MTNNSEAKMLKQNSNAFAKKVDFGAWAAVRCKNSSCDFIGIGLKVNQSVFYQSAQHFLPAIGCSAS